MARKMHPNSLANLQKGKDTQFGSRGDTAAKERHEKSVETKQSRKAFKDAIVAVLSEPMMVKDEHGKSIPHPSGMTVQEAMIRGVVGRAIKGDPRALEVIRDTIGEKPAQDVKFSTGDFSALDGAIKGMGKK